MSKTGEKQLICHLTDDDSLAYLITEGINLAIVPTPELREVVGFAMDYYMDSGGLLAPAIAVFEAHEISAGRTIANYLDDMEIPWREGYEASIQWILEDLRGTYLTSKAQTLMREGGTKLIEAPLEDRLEVFSGFVTDATELILDLQERRTKVEMTADIGERLLAYEDRVANKDLRRGLTMGLDPVDDVTSFIHPGELAMLAAYAKLGKSFALNRIALRAWNSGTRVALFTLENSIDMTLDRMACLAAGVDPARWQRGECIDVEVERIRERLDEMEKSDNPLFILSPDPGQRTPQAMVRMAQILDVEAIIIDQLSHIEHPDPGRKRPDIIETEKLRTLRLLVSTGRQRMPCLVAHQINREGKKAADKRDSGWHEMWDLAETAGSERETDFVFSMYQSNTMSLSNQALFQILASRRTAIKWWDISWHMDQGHAQVIRERRPYAS
jgi:DnaB-like helicase C terminal domain